MTKRRQNYMAKSDVLFSKLVRDRDGACLNCGATDWLQCAHIISRSYKSIRTNFDNAVALCRGCHKRFTEYPLEWRDWVEARFPGRWDFLAVIARSYEKVDWKHQYETLREMAQSLGVT